MEFSVSIKRKKEELRRKFEKNRIEENQIANRKERRKLKIKDTIKAYFY